MVWSEIALIAVGAVLVVVALAWIISACVRHRKKDGEVADKVYVHKDVRYTKHDEITEKDGSVRVSFREGDIVLDRGQTYMVAKGSKLLPGSYTVLVSDDNVNEVKIRTGGLTRSYSHNSSIVLADGDKVCAVSSNVILR